MFVFLILLVLVGLLFELFSVGIFIPIINKLSNNNNIGNGFITRFLGGTNNLKNFLFFALIIYFIKTLYILFLIHLQHK
jgi:hypothetical protein